ncbi:hypothetical protein AGMMS50267_16640 [Spirochaetia bacterium]|nr:hypothetical protein AGMMS50267_16640 [Spirochaetia bacterium]
MMLLLDAKSIITEESIDHADHAEAAGSYGSVGCALLVHNRPAVMVSPLDIQTYILEIPPLNQRRRDEAIRLQLRTRYPGDAAFAEIDYFLFTKQRNKHNGSRCFQAVVFLADSLTAAEYRDRQTPLIPGIALMMAALEKFSPDTREDSDTAGINRTGESGSAAKHTLVMIITPDWIEAAGFENREVTGHAAAKRTGVHLPLPLLEILCPGQDSSHTPALIILKDVPATDSLVSAAGERFTENRIIDMGDILPEVNIKKSAIFKHRDKQQQSSSKRIAAALIILQALSLLLALHILAVKAEEYHTALERTYREQTQYKREAEKLLAEIAQLENREVPTNTEAPGTADPYVLIAEIRSRLPDVLVSSIVIQGERFNFEAEGADSIQSLDALRKSSRFFDITLHQTTPSKRGGEQFSISGSIRHE